MAGRKKQDDSTFRFALDGKAYEIDADTLTFGEIESLEVYFDAAYSEIDLASMRGTMFMAYLAVHRVNPRFELDDIRKMELRSLGEAAKTSRPTSQDDANGGQSS